MWQVDYYQVRKNQTGALRGTLRAVVIQHTEKTWAVLFQEWLLPLGAQILKTGRNFISLSITVLLFLPLLRIWAILSLSHILFRDLFPIHKLQKHFFLLCEYCLNSISRIYWNIHKYHQSNLILSSSVSCTDPSSSIIKDMVAIMTFWRSICSVNMLPEYWFLYESKMNVWR